MIPAAHFAGGKRRSAAIQLPVLDALNVGASVNASTITATHVTGSGLTNSIAIVACAWSGSSFHSHTITGVTWGGTAMTAVTGTYVGSNSSTPKNVQLWYLVNPPSGSTSVIATLSSSTSINACIITHTFQHVAQSSTFGTANTTAGTTGTSTSASVTSAATTDLIFQAAVTRNQINNASNSMIYIDDYNSSSGNTALVTYDKTGSGGSDTGGVTWTTSDNFAFCIVPIHGAA